MECWVSRVGLHAGQDDRLQLPVDGLGERQPGDRHRGREELQDLDPQLRRHGHASPVRPGGAKLSRGQRGRGAKSRGSVKARRETLQAGPGDHGGVVGAERRRRRDHLGAGGIGHFGQARPQGPVRGHPAGDHQGPAGALGAEQRQSVGAAVGQHVGHRRLEGGGQIGGIGRLKWRVAVTPQGRRLVAHRGLETGKGKVAAGAPQHRPGQIEAPRIAAGRRGLEGRATGIAEAQQLRGLVEGLAHRVVQGGAQAPVAADPLDGGELAMAAGDQQQQIGEGHLANQAHTQGMPLEMVDRQERQAARRGDGLGGHDADEDAADQPRPGGRRNPVQIAELESRLFEGAGHQGVQMLQVGPGGDLGHHPAEGPVLVELREHQVGMDAPPVVDHGRRGFVARGLDPEHDHGRTLAPRRPNARGGLEGPCSLKRNRPFPSPGRPKLDPR